MGLFGKSAKVMIVDEMVSPFSRIWCLFEVKRLTDLQKDPPGAVGLLGPSGLCVAVRICLPDRTKLNRYPGSPGR